MSHQIEDVLQYGYIVAANEDGCLVTWNGSSTFNFWVYQMGIRPIAGYINTAVKTIIGPDLAMAERIAKEWLFNPNDYEVCHPCRRPTDPDEWIHGYCVDCHDWRKCDDCVRPIEGKPE